MILNNLFAIKLYHEQFYREHCDGLHMQLHYTVNKRLGEENKKQKISQTMQKRTILWYMTFWGFAMNFMLRMNLNIAIVSMVRHTIIPNENILLNNEQNNNRNSSLYDIANKRIDNKNGFDWNEHQQNSVKGAFFWLHMFMQIPGGMLAQKYSAKFLFGFSNGMVALLTCIIPFSARFNFTALLFIRVFQGVIAAASWPSMQTMTGKWIPPHERSRFVSAYSGTSVGTAVTYIACGYLMDWLGWESVFYVTGLTGLLWYGFWTFLIYDSPSTHPTISAKERKYIEDSLGDSVVNKKSSTIPWKLILTSMPFIANIVSQIGYNWGLYTLSLQAPTYLKFVLGFNLKQTGIWSGIPHLCIWPSSFAFGCACDYLIRTGAMSTTNVRKLACGFSNLVHGLCILMLSVSGSNETLVVFSLMSAAAVSGAITSGGLPGIVDLAPNYAGVLQGINGTVVATCISVSPYIVGLITFQQQTIEQWKKVFIVSAGVCSITGLAFLIFGNSKLQKWNNMDQKDSKEVKLMI